MVLHATIYKQKIEFISVYILIDYRTCEIFQKSPKNCKNFIIFAKWPFIDVGRASFWLKNPSYGRICCEKQSFLKLFEPNGIYTYVTGRLIDMRR